MSDFCACSLNDEQYDWVQLLENGRLPEHDIHEPIRSYVKGKFWLELLEKNMHGTWYEYNQLGVLYYGDGQTEKAAECFEKATAVAENPWSLRNSAQIEKNVNKQPSKAADLMLRAVAIKNDYVPLLVDCASALISAERYAEWEAVFNTLSPELQQNGRLRMLRGVCAIRMKNIPLSLEILNENLVVCDIREGEYALSAMWQELYSMILAEKTGRPVESITKEEVFEAYPLPYVLDYRMH